LRYKNFGKKRTKISKKYARVMEFHREFGEAAKRGGGAWTQPMPINKKKFSSLIITNMELRFEI
jgi:hypothetical protein